MGNIKIGETTSTMYVGTQEIIKIYQGAIKVFDTDPSGGAYAQIVKDKEGYKMADTDKSPAFTLNVSDVVEISKNTALVALAAGLAYLGENIGDLDLGSAGVMLVPIVSVVINTVVKWAKNNVPE